MELEIKHLAPYLPYGLKVEYKGILNGSEISSYNKEYNKDHEEDFLGTVYDSTYDPPKEIRGLKTGYIKVVECWKNGFKYRVGNTSHGLQTHYDCKDFKPILRPLSDLTEYFQKIWHEEETEHNKDVFKYTSEEYLSLFGIDIESIEITEVEYLPSGLVNLLCRHHFDLFNLIPNGLAIDANTL